MNHQIPSSAVTRATTPRYEIEGRMFEPGETVGVAVLLRSTEANQYGEVQATIAAADLPARWEALAFVGYDSGTLNYIDPR